MQAKKDKSAEVANTKVEKVTSTEKNSKKTQATVSDKQHSLKQPILKVKKYKRARETELNDALVERLKTALDKDLNLQLVELFTNLHAVDQANFIANLGTEDRIKLFKAINNQIKADVLVEISDNVREDLIDILGFDLSAALLSLVDIKDAVYVLDELSDDFRDGILESIRSSSLREILEEGLSYPEYSVGKLILGNGYVAVPMDWTVGQTNQYLLQEKGNLPKEFDSIILIDDNQHPYSEVGLSKILSNDDQEKLTNIMVNRDLIKTLTVNDDQVEVIKIFKRYRFNTISVVDSNGCLIGVVNLEDVIDIVEEEAEEDLMLMHGIDESDIHSSPAVAARSRFPWLFFGALTSSISSTIIGHFGYVIEKEVAIAAVLPVIASLCGSSGTQTSTVIIRSIATGQIKTAPFARIIVKEVCTCLINGILLALLVSSICYWRFHNFTLSMLLAIAMVAIMIFAGAIGTLIPLTINKLNLDPAVSSNGFVTAIVDMMSFTGFLILAKFFL